MANPLLSIIVHFQTTLKKTPTYNFRIEDILLNILNIRTNPINRKITKIMYLNIVISCFLKLYFSLLNLVTCNEIQTNKILSEHYELCKNKISRYIHINLIINTNPA